MKRPPVTRAEFQDDTPLWPSAAWAAVIVFVLFPVLVAFVSLGAWILGAP